MQKQKKKQAKKNVFFTSLAMTISVFYPSDIFFGFACKRCFEQSAKQQSDVSMKKRQSGSNSIVKLLGNCRVSVLMRIEI